MGKSGGSFVGTDDIGIPLTTVVVFVAVSVAVDDDVLRSRREFSKILFLLLVVIRRGSRVKRGWPGGGFERFTWKHVWVSCSGWIFSLHAK